MIIKSAMVNNSNARLYKNQYVQAVQEKTTSRSTYVQVKANDGKTFWIDKRALNIVTLDKVKSTKKNTNTYKISQDKTIDGIFYDAPYRTSAGTMVNNSNARLYKNQYVQAVQEKTTSRSTYVQVKANDGKTFWIDRRALT